MKEPCVLCHKLHEALNWKYSEYETTDGVRYGWFCEKWFSPSRYPEFVPQRIKDDREKNFNAVLQPYRGGEVSREYIEKYGTGRLKVSKKEVEKAKYVWTDLPGWHHRHKTK
jgi:hypothetical protein